jgi:hypothetical protein
VVVCGAMLDETNYLSDCLLLEEEEEEGAAGPLP